MQRLFSLARFELLTGIIALGTAVLMGLLILSSRSVMDAELQWHFERAALLDGNLNQVLLITKYEDQRRLFQEKASQQDVDASEYHLGQALENEQPMFQTIQWNNPLEQVSATGIDLIRRFTGKEPLPSQQDIENTQKLYEAFLLEHQRKYHRALTLYNELYPLTSDIYLRGVIRLHQGFCASLLDQKTQARRYFEEVISVHNEDNLGLVAALLLQHMDSFEAEEMRLSNSSMPALKRARKMVQLLRCKEATRILDTLQVSSKDISEKFLLEARCAEESGQQEEAAQKYLKAIASDSSKVIARDANRRLFLLAQSPSDTTGLQAISVKLNTMLQDSLVESFRAESTIQPEDNEPTKLSKELATETVAALESLQDSNSEVKTETAPPVAVVSNRPTKLPATKPTPTVQSKYAQGQRMQVRLLNGKEFTGLILSEPSENILRIQTLIGVIGIPREQIDTSMQNH